MPSADLIAALPEHARIFSALSAYDLVLMGQQSADSDAWVLPSMLAEKLGRPVLTQAAKLELADGGVKIERQTEAGYERLQAQLPAVVSVSDAAGKKLGEPPPKLISVTGAPWTACPTMCASEISCST